MSRHYEPLEEAIAKIHSGLIGEVITACAYRMHGPAASAFSDPEPDNISELMYQVQRFHSFLWSGGGCFSDFNIHIIDHLCWMKNGWPVKAQGTGGRHYKQSAGGVPFVDQNFDAYAVEYTFADGAKMFFDGRCQTGTHGIFSSYVHGTKGKAVVSGSKIWY